MKVRNGTLLAAISLGLLLAGISVREARAAHGQGRPLRGRTDLAVPDEPVDADAKGRCWVKWFPENARRAERSWFRLKLKRLEGDVTYTLWADDPSTPADPTPVQFDSFTTNGRGREFYRLDTKKGDALPFGATLQDLAGKVVEVRDEAGTTVVLSGTIPDLK